MLGGALEKAIERPSSSDSLRYLPSFLPPPPQKKKIRAGFHRRSNGAVCNVNATGAGCPDNVCAEWAGEGAAYQCPSDGTCANHTSCAECRTDTACGWCTLTQTCILLGSGTDLSYFILICLGFFFFFLGGGGVTHIVASPLVHHSKPGLRGRSSNPRSPAAVPLPNHATGRRGDAVWCGGMRPDRRVPSRRCRRGQLLLLQL